MLLLRIWMRLTLWVRNRMFWGAASFVGLAMCVKFNATPVGFVGLTLMVAGAAGVLMAPPKRPFTTVNHHHPPHERQPLGRIKVR